MPNENNYDEQSTNAQHEEHIKSLNSFICPSHGVRVSRGDECPRCRDARKNQEGRK